MQTTFIYFEVFVPEIPKVEEIAPLISPPEDAILSNEEEPVQAPIQEPIPKAIISISRLPKSAGTLTIVQR